MIADDTKLSVRKGTAWRSAFEVFDTGAEWDRTASQ